MDDEKFEAIQQILIRGEKPEGDISPEQARNFRCEELCAEFDLAELYAVRDDIEEEIVKRQERIQKLSQNELAFVTDVYEKIEDDVNVTREEADRLEHLYAITLPYAMLTDEQEKTVRVAIRAVAEKDFQDKRFESMKDALVHYGIYREEDDDGNSDGARAND